MNKKNNKFYVSALIAASFLQLFAITAISANLDFDNFVELNIADKTIEIDINYRLNAKSLELRQNFSYVNSAVLRFGEELVVTDICLDGGDHETPLSPHGDSLLRYDLPPSLNCARHTVRIQTKNGDDLQNLIAKSFDPTNKVVAILH